MCVTQAMSAPSCTSISSLTYFKRRCSRRCGACITYVWDLSPDITGSIFWISMTGALHCGKYVWDCLDERWILGRQEATDVKYEHNWFYARIWYTFIRLSLALFLSPCVSHLNPVPLFVSLFIFLTLSLNLSHIISPQPGWDQCRGESTHSQMSS